MEQVLDAGLKRIMLFFNQVKMVELSASEVRQLDPQEQSFQNINTPEDYFRLRGTLPGQAETEVPLQRSNS